MKSLLNRHKILWSNKSFTLSVMAGVILLVGSLFANYNALNYAIREVGSGTTDILLNNLPVVNTDIIFSEGALFFVVFITCLALVLPKTIPFTLKSIAMFVLIRSMFVTMTHLGLPSDHIFTHFNNLRYVGNAGADEFFSGHTGLPFLMALLFWPNRQLRLIFLFCSVAAAIAVILGHLHYTIDVFSAFFITYGIYHIALKAFPEDYKFFTQTDIQAVS